jgi:hypothetical protein
MQKYVVAKPLVPTIWLIQEGTNLIQKEVTTLEEARFSFYYNHAQSLFGSQSSSPRSLCACYECSQHCVANICKLLAHNLWWQENEMAFHVQNNTPTIGRLASYLPNALFSPLLMSPHLGMDKFTILFQTTKDMK